MSNWYLLPGFSASSEYLRRKYLYLMPPSAFCAVLVNIPRRDILKDFVPVSYYTELRTIFGNEAPESICPTVIPTKEVSVLGAHIMWDPLEIAKMISDFNQSLPDHYEGVCFFQPHGPGGLVSEDNVLVIHSYNTRFFGPAFSKPITPQKLFGVDLSHICTMTYQHHFAIPIYDDDNNIAGGWVPPGDLLCYWDVTHEDKEQMKTLFLQFLEKARDVIIKYRHKATYGEFPKVVLDPIIRTRAYETIENLRNWYESSYGLWHHLLIQYYSKLKQVILHAVEELQKDERVSAVDWYEVPMMIEFTIKPTKYFSAHTIRIELNDKAIFVDGESHGKKVFPGLTDDELSLIHI